ncbi:PepSY domain-containing protein [Salimicrobium halophilum]|uniref:Uncharacterized membrane protein YkoI n=1 Tax=Salimicrobium halophilum TaxID=86666 RepID=A0A1G8S693_9BACI|nr:PepSY domain-containing protein [Salimicrobium halophilum]SDJ24716.1 Uncharacterized membrane protein YkoI [Salimicrobium halophilum]
MRNKWLIGLGTAVLIGGGAFSVNALTNENSGPVDLSEEEATKIVQEEMQGFTVDSVKRDDDDGRAVYEVKGTTEEGKQLDVDIDANEGSITEMDHDGEDKEYTGERTLSEEEAKTIAKEEASGSITEFEIDDGHYEVEVKDGNTEYELTIHGQTGEVLEFEQEEK